MSTPRPVVIAANWKMHKLRSEALEYVHDLATWIDDNLGTGEPGLWVVVAPPFVTLELAVEAQPPFGVYAQTMHQSDQGAYTGEVSAPMLKDMGVDGVILGHSERRQYFAETDEALAGKIQSAIAFGLAPMLCVGETLQQRNDGEAMRVVTRQLEIALADVESDGDDRLTIAYEPVWAIGTGETATPEQAQEMHAGIRACVGAQLGADRAAQTPILYGGSVKPDNAHDLLAMEDIDGALVGGAALEVESFSAIIEAGRVRARDRNGAVA